MALREEFDEQELKDLYTIDYRSHLSELFYGDNMKMWDEFCAASEEEQRRIIRGLEQQGGSKGPRRTTDPKALYERLDRRVKGMLKRGAGRDFLKVFENKLCCLLHEDAEFVEENPQFLFEINRSNRGASVDLEDSMQRLVAHAVCSYHCLHSFSRDRAEGSGAKTLIIQWPFPDQPPSPRPKTMLHEYLDLQD